MSLVFTPAGLELLDDLEDDLERGVGVRLAIGNDLDADHVARLEEVLPGLDGVGGPGQLFHAVVERRLDGRGIRLPLWIIARIPDLDDLAGIEAGRRELAQGLDVAALMRGAAERGVRWALARAGSAEMMGTAAAGTQELPPIQPCERTVTLHGSCPLRRGIESSEWGDRRDLAASLEDPQSLRHCPAKNPRNGVDASTCYLEWRPQC